mmetsp:Transcript_5885/g.7682  ORF Transcript_5885/g.7682 Transcript_5885/m.7682 type:complete len:310 (+) Transcript_5885:52-981(+)|eukprot:CAMPEP_0204869894 /NCGR_PEP_ID=MMETSP1348-20121228/30964_1 /ASSEMBLY_ACC=CAM_ASM_000700 /TAXON_ID=215587 /ORGANISM="Aplanochytrium stocchinoi, Strain GSBS06" /LENGTH=309 /DNA_ID=CAMNT_0052023427 /DNA_START=33 /DNA_END=962 /DNA_ORIENTATION=+
MSDAEDIVTGILKTLTVASVVEDQVLQEARGDEKISDVADRLTAHHISSCPVFASEKDTKEFLGLVDFSDVVALLLNAEWRDVEEGQSIWKRFGNTPVAKAIDLGTRNPTVRINLDARLVDAVRTIADQNLRRLVVEDDHGQVVAVLSPSKMMKHIIAALKGRLDTTLTLPVKELDLNSGPVLSVTKKETLLAALHRMLNNRVSAIAVVDDKSGHLAGSLSMSDVKVLFLEKKFKRLQQSCWKYITNMREQSDFEIFPFFGVSEEAKLQVVISKLLVTSVHHLYVVDKENNPLRVISFADVCKGLLANI